MVWNNEVQTIVRNECDTNVINSLYTQGTVIKWNRRATKEELKFGGF